MKMGELLRYGVVLCASLATFVGCQADKPDRASAAPGPPRMHVDGTPIAVVGAGFANSDSTNVAPDELKGKFVSVRHVEQETGAWCWAACIQALPVARLNAMRQCDIVSRALNGINCCGNPPPGECVNTGQEINLELFNLKGKILQNATGLDWLGIKQQIDRGTPIIFSWQHVPEVPSGQPARPDWYHVMLLFGYQADRRGHQWVRVMDPSGVVPEFVRFGSYQRGQDGRCNHVRDYIDIEIHP